MMLASPIPSPFDHIQYAVITGDIAADSRLSKNDFRVWITMSVHANRKKNDTAWPSVARICALTGITSQSRVRESLNRLVEFGWLQEVERRSRGVRAFIVAGLGAIGDAISPGSEPDPGRNLTP